MNGLKSPTQQVVLMQQTNAQNSNSLTNSTMPIEMLNTVDLKNLVVKKHDCYYKPQKPASSPDSIALQAQLVTFEFPLEKLFSHKFFKVLPQ